MDEDAAFGAGIFVGVLLCILAMVIIAACSSAFEDTDTYTQLVNDTLIVGDDEYLLRQFDYDGANCVALLDSSTNVVGLACDWGE